MSVLGAPDLLIELLTEAARTPGGQVGLLRAGQVAEILGRHRDWVQTHATQLGGFRLPGSDEWRFVPRGVAHGIFGLDNTGVPPLETSPSRRGPPLDDRHPARHRREAGGSRGAT